MLDTKTNFVDEKVEIDPKDLQVSFDNNTTETKDTETNNDSKIVKVSLGNDAEALAEEKSKPKDKQDKDKIKQLKKSIKDREKEIKDQVKNNKKYKPDTNAWNGVIDDENADDWSYIANNWKIIPQSEDFKHVANKSINKDITNVSKDKDREYYLNLSQRGFEEWNGMQENPDDPDNYKKWEEENQKWKDNAKKTLLKYTPVVIKPYLTKYEIDEINPVYVKKSFKMAMNEGDYDAASILRQALINAEENEKAQNEKKSTKKEKMYRVSPSKNGNYYVVECSYDGGKTWNFVDSSPSQEEANRKMEYLKKGLTTSGLTQEEAKAKASIPEDTSTNDNSDKTESTKKENENNVITLTQYEIDHPNFTENNKNLPKGGVNFSIGGSNDVITTDITNGTNGASTEDKPPKKSSYWTNFLYGNDKGSVQNDKEAQAEKEKKMDDFLKNNPNLVKAIFGKNSGLNFGERVVRLGEMLAMIGADATKGAYAGFNHQALPEATKGRYSEIYNNALKNQYKRKQDIFESENKANIDKANRISILKSSPILSKLDENMLSQLADKIVTGIAEAEWDNYENALQKKGYNTQEIEEIKSTFNALRNTFSDVTTQRGNVVELNGKEFDLMRKPQQAIAELQAQKAKLNEQLVQVRTLKYEQLKSFLQSFKSTYAGIQSVSDSMSENKNFGYNASVNVKGGIPVVKLSASASGGVNGSNGSAKSTGTNTDQLALEGLQTGKIAAEEWNKDTATYRRLLEDSIKEAIKEIDSQIAALKKFHSIDDGIVKAPHMKQWLVREDGTRIALNPSDNIYATKNKLTTKKDNKSENIVPMEKEDKVVVIQKKLGHNCDKRIIKNNDYYLSKLK